MLAHDCGDKRRAAVKIKPRRGEEGLGGGGGGTEPRAHDGNDGSVAPRGSGDVHGDGEGNSTDSSGRLENDGDSDATTTGGGRGRRR